MGRRFARITSAICIVAGTLLAPTSTAASEAGTVSGEVAFECHAHFDAYPTASGYGVCESGLVPALAQVSLAGTADGNAYLVDGVGNVRLDFTHSDACIADEPPLLWTMQGTMSISGVPALHNGQVMTARVNIAFNATVAASTIAFLVTGSQVSLDSGATASGQTGAGSGTFFPLLGVGNHCPEGGPMEALIQGEIDLPT